VVSLLGPIIHGIMPDQDEGGQQHGFEGKKKPTVD